MVFVTARLNHVMERSEEMSPKDYPGGSQDVRPIDPSTQGQETSTHQM